MNAMLSPQRFGYHATYWTVPLLQDLRKNLGTNFTLMCECVKLLFRSRAAIMHKIKKNYQ